MSSKCRHTQLQMMDWFYDEQEQQNWDMDHAQQCRECRNYYQQLLKTEKNLPRRPLEFEASEDFIRSLEDHVRREGVRSQEQKEKGRIFKELGAFPAAAIILLTLMGSLFYNDIGPSFIQVQLAGLFLFPFLIPILGIVEKRRRQGSDPYGS